MDIGVGQRKWEISNKKYGEGKRDNECVVKGKGIRDTKQGA